jgi:hypothetical protein
MMSYALTETAKAVVASAFTFIASGRPAAPSLAVEGLWYDVLGGQEPYDVAISERPVTVSLVNGWTQEARIGWMLNNFQTDERYAAAWHIARRAMTEFPVEFARELDRLWEERTTKTG